MAACPQCGAEYDSAQPDVERCESCGCFLPRPGTIQPSAMDLSTPPESVDPSEPPPASPPPAPSPKRSSAAFIQPRTLSPEYAARVTAHWEGTHSVFKNPKETIHSSAATSEDEEGLVIGMRNVVGVDDEHRGDYELTEIIGQGGMGQVWSAKQSSLDRDVALKFPHVQSKGSQRERDKFIFEVLVTGRLDHPNIVPIYDFARDTDGRLFYAMKRVDGRSWDSCIHDGSLSQEQNIEILMKVCDALRFAHAHGVIHCDIKPHNIMVGKFGEVSVMDFGAAVRLDGGPGGMGSGKASPGGTPAYMAPEIAANSRGQICAATDVYLLGAVLYEILSGEPPHPPPHDSKSHREMIREAALIAAENRITPLGKSGELVDIVYKAMATEISRRYQTVDDFQKAIRNYLSHAESIALADHGQQHLRTATDDGHGTPTSLGVRFDEFDRARFAFDEAIKLWPENRAAKKGREEATLAYANFALREGAYSRGISLLDAENPEHVPLLKKLNSARKNANRTWFLLRCAGVIIVAGGTALSAVIFFQKESLKSTYGELTAAYASLNEKNTELTNETKRANKNAGDAKKNAEDANARKAEAELAKDAAVIASNDALQQKDRALSAETAAQQSAYISEIGVAEEALGRNGFNRVRGILLAQNEPGSVKRPLRNWEWGYLNALSSDDRTKNFMPGKDKAFPRYESAAISSDGQWIVAASVDGKVFVWKRQNAVQPIQLRDDTFKSISSVAVASPSNGKYVVAVAGTLPEPEGQNVIKIWNLNQDGSSELVAPPFVRASQVLSLALSRDASQLLIGSSDGVAELLDCRSGNSVAMYPADLNKRSVWCARFSPGKDEKWIVTASDDGIVRVWDKNKKNVVQQLSGHRGPVLCATFSSDGKHVISGGYDGRLLAGSFDDAWGANYKTDIVDRLKDRPLDVPVSKLTLIGEHAAPIKGLSSSSNGNHSHLFSASNDNTVSVWDVSQGVNQARLEKTLRGHGGWVRACAAIDLPDNEGPHVLSAGYDGRVRLWDWPHYDSPRVLTHETGESLQRQHLTSSAIAGQRDSSGKIVKVEWIATASDSGRVVVWDMENGKSPKPLELSQGHQWQATTGIFFRDGQRLLTAGGDNTTLVWDANQGNELKRIGKWSDLGTGWRGVAAVSSDGQRIATGSGDGRINVRPEDARKSLSTLAQIWSADSGTLMVSCSPDAEPSSSVEPSETAALAFSEDDRRLVVGDQLGQCHVFDAASGKQLQRFSAHRGRVTSMRFLPNTRYLLTAGSDGQVVKWDLSPTEPQLVARFTHGNQVAAMDVSADGKYIVTAAAFKNHQDAGSMEVACVWNAETNAREKAIRLDAVLKDLNLPLVQKDAQARNGDAPSLPMIRSVAFHASKPIVLLTVYSPSPGLRDDIRSRVGRWDWQDDRPIQVVSEQRDVSMAIYSRPPAEDVLTVGGRGARLLSPASAGGDVRANYATSMSFRPQTRVNAISFSADGKLLACVARDGSIKIWKAGDRRKWISGPTIPGDAEIHSIAFYPKLADDTGYQFVTAGLHGVQFWTQTADSFRVERTYRPSVPGEMVQAIFSQDGTRVLGVAKNQAIYDWDRATGNQRRRLTGPKNTDLQVQCVCISTDGKWIAAGCGSEARFWNESSNEPHPLQAVGHWGEISSLCLSPDSPADSPPVRLFTASQDFMVKVWDTTALAQKERTEPISELLTLAEHQGFVTSVAFSPDGSNQFVLTTGGDGQAILWPSDMTVETPPPTGAAQ